VVAVRVRYLKNYINKLKKLGIKNRYIKENSFIIYNLELFYKNVGIVRTKTELQNAKKTIIEIKNKIPQMGVKDTSKIYNTNLIDFLEFINMIDICETVVDGALKREKSCGAHFIEDEL